ARDENRYLKETSRWCRPGVRSKKYVPHFCRYCLPSMTTDGVTRYRIHWRNLNLVVTSIPVLGPPGGGVGGGGGIASKGDLLRPTLQVLHHDVLPTASTMSGNR